MTHDPPVTLPLSEITRLALGKGDCGGFTTTTPLVAEVIKGICKDSFMLHVQTHDRNGNVLEAPRLWHLASWRQDTERFLITKRYMDEQLRISRILEENVKIIARRLRLAYDFDEINA